MAPRRLWFARRLAVVLALALPFGVAFADPDPPRLSNISTRMEVLTGNNVLIAGFIIGGSAAKTLAITATGPSLAPFGIANFLANPEVTLVRSSDQAIIATNDDWQSDANHAQLQASGFAPGDPREAGLYVTLSPGAYTAIVSGKDGTTGVSVVGVFEVDHPEIPLANISTRGDVLTGENVMIAGLIVQGSGPQTLAITATGPSLGAFGVTNALANPTLTLVRSSDQSVIATNNGWQTAPNASQILASGFAPADPRESALMVTLDPGAYTAIVQGPTGNTGVSVVGVFAGQNGSLAIGKRLLASRGVWAAFDRRGWPNGYFSGDAVRMINQFDGDLAASVGAGNVSATVGAEISSQLAKMQAMGINHITFELRATDPTFIPGFTPPTCNLPPALGLLWPQPTALELTNLPAFLDLAQAHGMKVTLILNNTHMEEQPPTNATQWLGAILPVVKDHPALDTVVFGGSEHVVQNGPTSTCGIPAEAPLYLGATSYAGRYVQWAIGYGLSLGVAPAKLSAEAIVGDYYVDLQPPAGCEAEDCHLWSSIAVLKQIFDNLAIDPDQRTYVLSMYSHRKCLDIHGFGTPCTEADPHAWADQTLANVRNVVGGARVVAAEYGDMAPFAPGWDAPLAVESLTTVMSKYLIEGGDYWIWTETDASTDADPSHAGEAVRKRGLSDVYNPVQRELLDAYGFHLASITNGSFEDGAATPTGWTSSGSGTATRYRLADEPGQPVISTRGAYVLRLVSGSGSNDQILAESDAIAVSPGTAYTTTANLRFQWSGDPLVGSPNPSRPHVFMSIRYFAVDGSPSAVRAEDAFPLFQEDGNAAFGTFPNAYTTPTDARSVRIVFGVARNGLSQPITLDVDNAR
jgi:hypothetical protein